MDKTQDVYLSVAAKGSVGYDDVGGDFKTIFSNSRGGRVHPDSSGKYHLDPGKYYVTFDRGIWEGWNREPYTLCVGIGSGNPGYVTMKDTVAPDPLTEAVLPRTETRYRYTVKNSAGAEQVSGYAAPGQQMTVYAGWRPGYTFKDWTVSGSGLKVCAHDYITFTMPAKDIVLTANWKEGGSYTPVKPSLNPFVDVGNEWYTGAVNYAYQHMLFGGMSENTFEPNTPMTRAMLVTVLWRYEGEPREGENLFNDVPEGQWFTEPVKWAAHNQIVNGVDDKGHFAPENNITREQMAAILYRYASGKGMDVSGQQDLGTFPDAGAVSGNWALKPLQWAVAEKLIGGSDGKLLPQGPATRAQVATILMRFIENKADR